MSNIKDGREKEKEIDRNKEKIRQREVERKRELKGRKAEKKSDKSDFGTFYCRVKYRVIDTDSIIGTDPVIDTSY